MTTLLDAINALQAAQHIIEEVADLKDRDGLGYYSGQLSTIGHIAGELAEKLVELDRKL